ncbi:SgcJ/EcaC family oxidoreductase [Nocardia otitidiscaviarum]|uniref:SgcJ/EcaC family oxidoreductase n=1 Tax=Nocardia otitidiscaviarum TaxID=1823 RepID=A0A516NN41_9NOCA|nr:SgcJ/EcaC family oxidoreductase [Nocardia otitidiscaviarum]MCP9624426.1 SgcJ/EcaC family oxidoreductase [Nocardia otitidiscaviarum]QDP80320.1 SgcJ/EcaC family oxidoreductase [Nocardia otitidiscaviarum]
MTTPTDATPADTVAARAAVLDLLHAQMDAWAAGDGTAFAATFTDDAVFISVLGEYICGRAELAAVMQQGFDGFMRGTRMSEPTTLTIDFPVPDLAVMVTITPRPSPPGVHAAEESIQTRIAVRAHGAWRFTNFHNTHRQAQAV